MISSTPSDFTGAIRVEKLSKSYPIRKGDGSSALKFNELVSSQMGRVFTPRKWKEKQGYFTALDQVSFEIQPGELVGLVGKNGSGKSTLLKLLARVTKPTSGRAWLRGRVGSLLEVGTGFHPELTGYENVFLCGTILGMTREEIAHQFEAIVAFSEVGPFLHIPVKRLSSGMAMRLAFSVAAHLSPNILLVDEALSVGDAAFQKKCLAKLQEFVASGVTVIFVTHDLSLVNKWCKRVLLLEQGRLIEDGPALDVMPRYLAVASPATSYRLTLKENPLAEKTGFSFREVVVNAGEPVRHGSPFRVEVTFQTLLPQERLVFGLALSSLAGTRLVSCDSDTQGERISLEAGKIYSVALEMRRLDLGSGSYLLDIAFKNDAGMVLDERIDCLRIEVQPAPNEPEAAARRSDVTTRPVFDWTVTPV